MYSFQIVGYTKEKKEEGDVAMDFDTLYTCVRGIVHKTRKEYYVKLWEKEDWDQEGMMVLYQLLQSHPDLAGDLPRLYIYYKVKFRNYIKDIIRKQESQKRKFDRMSHEDIDSLSHLIGTNGLITDELVLLRSCLSDYRSCLTLQEHENYEKLISGESFQGRKAMLRDLELHLKDFRPG